MISALGDTLNGFGWLYLFGMLLAGPVMALFYFSLTFIELDNLKQLVARKEIQFRQV